ncbi:MAG: hypothetical protein LBQ65_02100 [Tannerellaceae bacterium]|jgi:hypothetical protein|nr:hypothetical protein [Tannerellaceae bacterium]
MKHLELFFCTIGILIFSFAMVGCGNEKVSPEPPPPDPPVVVPPDEPPVVLTPGILAGTKWKLARFVDVQTGMRTLPEPSFCTECFTLTFDTDSTALGRSITMDVKINLMNLNPKVMIEDIYIDEGYPDGHGQQFRTAILTTASFTVSPDELKLFYHDKQNYLLFRRVMTLADLPAGILAGTKWKLGGFLDVKTGKLTVVEPRDCEECYKLTFDTDSTASGRSITMNVKINLLKLNPDKFIEDIYIDEGHRHGHDFRIAMLIAASFTVTPDELKLFYHDKQYCLLFRREMTLADLPAGILAGTEWKLAEFVDVHAGTRTVPEPRDCAECYTLTFDTDSTASGRSITADVKINLMKLNPNVLITDEYWDEGYPDGNAQQFRIAMVKIAAFTVSPDELKLFYYGKYYLLFKRKE